MEKKTIFLDMDGTIADFTTGYISAFNRDPHKDDSFTVGQFCRQEPHFFRDLPELEKGMELFDILKDDYNIVFLTTPMKNMKYCRIDKINWIKENIGNDFDVIFSDNKHEYAIDNQSILIDDLRENIEKWDNAGGTGIRFDNKIKIDKIVSIIEETLNNEVVPKGILDKIIVKAEPTEKEKTSGNYKKGHISLNGLDIAIENTPGSVRWGIGIDNHKWLVKMKDFYGYIKGSTGNDGDEVDCFINPKGMQKSLVFIINQMNKGLFDEVKCMLGYDNEEDAKKAYLRNYGKGQEENIHSIVRTNTKKLRSWVANGNYTEPFE